MGTRWGCAGCVSWFRGLARQPHTQACRERFEAAMKGEAKVAMAEEKQKEFKRRLEAKKKSKVEAPKEEEEEEEVKTEGDEEETIVKEDDGEEDERMAIEGVEADRLRLAGAEMGLWRGVKVEEAMKRIEVWIHEARVTWEANERQEEVMLEEAWDDVKGGKLKMEDLRKARKEEVGYMNTRGDLGGGAPRGVLAEDGEEANRGKVGGH